MTPKLVIVLIGVAVALVLWRGELPSGRMNRSFLLLLAACAASLVLSTALSTHPALSLNGGSWRRLGLVSQIAILLFAMLAAIDCSSGRDRVNVYLNATMLGAVPVALYAVLQYFGWDPWLPKQSYHAGDFSWSIIRPPSTMGHASYLATYLVFVVFCCAHLAMQRVWRTASIATAALCCVAIVLSGTRAALLALVVGAVFAAVRMGVRVRPLQAIGLAAAFVLMSGAFYFSPAGQAIRNRVTWTSMEPFGGARPLLWRDSLRMSAHHLALGYGPESFLTDFPRYQSADLERAFPEFQHESPHNIFLDALLSSGIIGMVILGGLCVWGFAAARDRPLLGAALAAGITAQLFTSFVLPTVFFFFLILALLAQPDERRRVRSLRLAAVACALALTFFAVRFTVADQALASASAALDRGDLASADRAHRRYEEWTLPGAGSDLYYSRRLAEFANKSTDFRKKALALQEGFTAAAGAARNSEQPANAWYNMAAFLALTNSATDVEHSLRNAIAVAPNWYKPHWVLAQLLEREQRLDEACREAETAAKLNPNEPRLNAAVEKLRAAQRQ